MPRNEFKAGDDKPTMEEIFELIESGNVSINKAREMLGLEVLPGEGELVVPNQEVEPVEVDPHMWPPETAPTLAELRKSGRSTTAAHIARPATSED